MWYICFSILALLVSAIASWQLPGGLDGNLCAISDLHGQVNSLNICALRLYLKGGGRRAEKKLKPTKTRSFKKKSTDVEPEEDSEGILAGKPERHRRYFRRNRFSSTYNKDFDELVCDWEASWNNKTGYDLDAPAKERPGSVDTEKTRWFETRKMLKKTRNPIVRSENNDSAVDAAEEARLKADTKRVQQLLGIR
jgi:hypothetical protein